MVVCNEVSTAARRTRTTWITSRLRGLPARPTVRQCQQLHQWQPLGWEKKLYRQAVPRHRTMLLWPTLRQGDGYRYVETGPCILPATWLCRTRELWRTFSVFS